MCYGFGCVVMVLLVWCDICVGVNEFFMYVWMYVSLMFCGVVVGWMLCLLNCDVMVGFLLMWICLIFMCVCVV